MKLIRAELLMLLYILLRQNHVDFHRYSSQKNVYLQKKRIIARIPNMYIDIIICMQKKYDTKRDKDFCCVMNF